MNSNTKIKKGFGDLMTSEEMKSYIECSAFIDDDGYGIYSDGIYLYDSFLPSNFDSDRSTHVVWFNK